MGNFLDSSGLSRVWNKISTAFLSKSGGTMTGTLSFSDNVGISAIMGGGTDGWGIVGSGSDDSGRLKIYVTDNGTTDWLDFEFRDYSGTIYTPLSMTGNQVAFSVTPTINGNSVWHAGNDGSGSGLDSDTVDGYHASSFALAHSHPYVSCHSSSGSNNLECLQNFFESCPKSVGTSVYLSHGSASMAFGWFLNYYDYANAYGGWFISDYSTPVWVGVSGGSWRVADFIMSDNWSSYIGTSSSYVGYASYATSAGNSDTVDSEHASAFAHRGQANNLLVAGNEFNFISDGFSGGVWFNYQDANRQNGANVNTYYFGNGAGGALAYITSGYFSGTAASATTCSYPYGFTSRGTSDWSGVSGTFATDWSVNGADLMFKYDGSKLNVITDGYFYQGIDIYGSSKRVLDTYDRDNTTWSNADTLDGSHASAFATSGHTHDGRYTRQFASPRDFSNGTLVRTDIDYSHESGNAFLGIIRADTYNGQQCWTTFSGYIYYNTIISYGLTNMGSFRITSLIAQNVDGKLCFWMPRWGYWQSFGFTVYVSNSDYITNHVTSIEDRADPNGSKRVQLCDTLYNSARTSELSSYLPLSGGTITGSLTVNGNIYAGGTITAGSASDQRLKENINPLPLDDAKNVILNSKPVEFTWRAEATDLSESLKGQDYGMIAQDEETRIPQAVGTIFNDYKRLDYTKYVPFMIKMLQDYEERIRSLEEQLKHKD